MDRHPESTKAVMFPGFYRCHNCGRDVERTRKIQRFFLCDDCWHEVTPNWAKEVKKEGREPAWYAETPEQRKEIEAYWGWVKKAEKRFPLNSKRYRFVEAERLPLVFIKDPFYRAKQYLSWAKPQAHPYDGMFTPDDFYPYCECGRERKEYEHTKIRSLFGAPRAKYCPWCEERHSMESLARMADKIHPGRDDEEWLDLLYKTNRRAFDLGVLPDYWFELRRPKEANSG